MHFRWPNIVGLVASCTQSERVAKRKKRPVVQRYTVRRVVKESTTVATNVPLTLQLLQRVIQCVCQPTPLVHLEMYPPPKKTN